MEPKSEDKKVGVTPTTKAQKPTEPKKEKMEKEKGSGKGVFIFLILLLLAGNGAFGWLWFKERGRANKEVVIKEEIIIERDNVKEDLMELQDAYATLQTNDKAMQLELDQKRVQIDSLLTLAEEHKNDKAIIAQLRREARSLRKIMKHYVHEIDSLNTLNRNIIADRDRIYDDLTSEKTKTTQLSKAKSSLENTVALASALQATAPEALGVKFKSGGAKESYTDKASRVEKIKVSFVLAENTIAEQGERAIYVRIVTPDGKEITKSPDESNMFTYGESRGYFAKSKYVNYKNAELPVEIFCPNPNGFVPGKYLIDIACEGRIIGQTSIVLK